MNIAALIKRHPILSYFVVAFGISWIGSLVSIAPKFITHQPAGTVDFVVALLAMLIGPCVAGVLLTWIVDGRQGLHDLGVRMRRWKVGLGWYAVALLTVPVLLTAVLLILSGQVSPAFVPGFSLLGIIYGILAGFGEEVGWMGFAFPKMNLKFGALGAALILGPLHAFWHIVADYLGAVDALGAYWFPHYALQYLVAVTLLRVVIVWVYQNTGSLLLAQLFHASSTGFLVALGPAGLTPIQETILDGAYSIALGAVVLAVIFRYGPALAHKIASPPAAPGTTPAASD